VILIEADLRRPSMRSALGVETTYGTEEVLIGEIELDEALVDADLGSTSVRVLAVENPGPDLADRLSFAAAQQLIKHARALSEYVVIDSPPLTAVSDALPLAQLVDEVLVVARIGSTRMSKLRELRDILLEERSYPTGIVLIGAPSPRGGYYYYSLDHTASRRPRARAAQPSRGEAETIHPLPK
jgi:Mrp family chromosome partitioning ATPase